MTRRYNYVILLIAAIVIGLISSAGAVCPECNAAGCVCTSDTEATLLAGQHQNVGLVSVDLVKDVSGNGMIEVKYQITGGWVLEDAHLYVGTVPPTNSAPGQFPYKVEDLGGVTEYTFLVSYPAGYADPCGPQNDGTVVQDAFYLAPHGVVSKNGHQESTWANGTLIREKKNWAMYFGVDINVQCNDCPVAVNDAFEAVEDTELEVPAATGVLANDADEEGNTITVVSNTQPENGSLTLNADGSFTYMPEADYCGSDSFTYSATDGICDTPVSATVSINVACVEDNVAPDAADDEADVNKGSSVIVSVLDNDVDADGDDLTIASMTQPAVGTAVDNGNGTITYTSTGSSCDDDSFTYTVSDGALTDTATVAVNVNCPPVPAFDGPYTVYQGEPLTVEAPGVLANDEDPDGDSLTALDLDYLNLMGIDLTLNPDGSFTLVPDDQWWVDSDCGAPGEIPYAIFDRLGYGYEDLETGAADGHFAIGIITIELGCTNEAPDAVDDEADVNTGSSVIVSVLDNDVDADGDDLTITSTTEPAVGTVVDNGNGTVTYTSTGSSCDDDSFTYTVSDGALTDTATVAVTVNCPPVAAIDGPYTIYPGVPLTVEAPGLLANDEDPDGDSLTALDLDYLTLMGIDLTLNPDGSFTLVPDDQWWVDSGCGAPGGIPYAIFDRPGYGYEDTMDGGAAEGHFAIGYMTFELGCVDENQAPDAADDFARVWEDSSVVIPVLANDADPDGDSLTIDSVSDPASGTATNNGNGTVTYTPDENYGGIDTFEYTVSDGNGGYDTALVEVAIPSLNDAPTAVDDPDMTDSGVPVDITVLGNDFDVDEIYEENVLTVESVTDPAGGSAAINGDGTITYTPDAGFCGTDTFQYTINDGNGGSGTATVTINVACPENACPVATDDVYNNFPIGWTTMYIPASSGVLANDFDDDGDPLTVVDYTPTGHDTCTIIVNADGSFSFSSQSPEWWGHTDTITYYVSDGECTSEATLTVNSYEP